ncbi:hypothetical protein SORBI_3001G065150 [Sorghum bicolor]|uniref:Uncharacterized protein n=1 Tax=Sorghum bicolor TaxID=4558 RepID=A0A1Z5S4M6_SORBI|nr:hypothetical protein SORBI_3001G065150 [Sorghum bicolor]
MRLQQLARWPAYREDHGTIKCDTTRLPWPPSMLGPSSWQAARDSGQGVEARARAYGGDGGKNTTRMNTELRADTR